jgi:ABC-type transport system substrate-binding protein
MRKVIACGWPVPVLVALALAAPVVMAQAPVIKPGRAPAPRELKVAVADFTGEKPDPIHGGFGMMTYQNPVFDYLVTMGPDRKPTPGLAQSWDISRDGRTYTFTLRRGVKWHTGDDFTAEDVAFHFERLKKGTGAFFGVFSEFIEAVEVPEPYRSSSA